MQNNDMSTERTVREMIQKVLDEGTTVYVDTDGCVKE